MKGIGVKAGDQPNTKVLTKNDNKDRKKEGCC